MLFIFLHKNKDLKKDTLGVSEVSFLIDFQSSVDS